MTDPKPPTVEELVREAHMLADIITIARQAPSSERNAMRAVIDALAARARLADSYGAELLAVLEVAKRAGGQEVTAEKAMIEMVRERDEARGKGDRLREALDQHHEQEPCTSRSTHPACATLRDGLERKI